VTKQNLQRIKNDEFRGQKLDLPDFVALVPVSGFVVLTVIVIIEMVVHLIVDVLDVDFPDINAGMIAIKMIAHDRRKIVDSHDGVVVIIMVMVMHASAKKAQRDEQRQRF
jgi:hypothetical protein